MIQTSWHKLSFNDFVKNWKQNKIFIYCTNFLQSTKSLKGKIGQLSKSIYLYIYLIPLTPTIFVKWAFSFWPPEFKTVGIFSISFFVTETWHFSIFGFLKTVNEGFCWKISIFYSAKQSPLWSQHFFLSLTVFEIEHKRLNFPFFKSVPHSVLKIWHSKKAFCTKNNQIILFWKINYNCFFAESRDT